VDHALLGAEPAQLAVARQPAPERAGVGQHRLELEADDQRRERLDRGDLDLGPAPDRERERVPLEPVAGVGAQDHVRAGVVGARVHGIGSVEPPGGREAHVDRLQRRDPGHNHPMSYQHPEPDACGKCGFWPPETREQRMTALRRR
jgi:hypothetical protein